ncbi:sensor domain-containing protein [Oceanobacillus halophilus]|uniref:sensor domain-containing protein n=1 Tax=Oceanobacillus halophilus TaxID=930130 RepID=UPI001F4DF4C5|nr:EAL domain-containing protein [Oceanobacillus halophilus]
MRKTTTNFIELRSHYIEELKENKTIKLEEVIQELADLRYALDQAAIVTITDDKGNILYVNSQFCKISKYTKEELIGQNHRMLNSGHHSRDYYKNLWDTVNSGNVWRGELRNIAKDGTILWLDTTIVPFLDENGKPFQFVSIRDDITKRKQMEEQIRKSEETYRLITENTSDVITVINKEGDIIYVTPSCSHVLNYQVEEVEHSKFIPWIHKEDQETVQYMVNSIFNTKKPSGEMEFQLEKKDGTYLDVEANISPIFSQSDEIDHLVLVIRDITKRKYSEKMIYHLTHHDTLTELPNRSYFMNHVTKEFYHAKVNEVKIAVLYMDIDKFKNINDSLGHENGDIALIEIANRLKMMLNPKDFIARIGGDEFAIIMVNTSKEQAIMIADKVMVEIQKPITLAKEIHTITASIGISMYPFHAKSPEELLKRANIASDEVKAKGRNNYLFFNKNMEENSLERILLENELKKAIESDQFTLDYQPKIDIKSGKIIGMEALVRWVHPELGRISPGKFIPIAEETGLILELGELILRKGCKQNKQWQNQGYPKQQLSVNLSTKQLYQKNLSDKIEAILEETGLEAQWLELEITESAFANISNAQTILLKIKDLGVAISIDDFGTGYSSFGYLKHLPVNTLKIDAIFIRDINLNPESQAIVNGIVDIAGKLKLNVIAEGIETNEQLCILREVSCPQGQGFYFSKPLSKEKFERYLKEII